MWFLLDRDGVINQDSDNFVRNAAEWVPLPGSIESIARLIKLGHHVIVCTNQSGVGRGLFSLDDLHLMHAKLEDLLLQHQVKLDHIYYCPHHPDDACSCRKPKPGMLIQAAKDFGFNAKQAVMVGDSKRDLDAGIAFGCPVVLLKTGKGKQTMQELAAYGSDFRAQLPIYDDFSSYVEDYLQGN